MKRLFLIFAFVAGIAHTSSAQSDYSLISKFLTSVVNQDASAMMEVLHPNCYKEVAKLMGQSDMLDLEFWELAATSSIDGYTFYVAAMFLSDNALYSDVLSYETRERLVAPAGCIFAYEMLYVVNDGGKKYVCCNGDLLSITRLEQRLRNDGKSLPAKYYEER